MRAAWKTGSLTSRLNAPTRSSQGALGDAMPGMLSMASPTEVSMRP